jgi:hypothetical protein
MARRDVVEFGPEVDDPSGFGVRSQIMNPRLGAAHAAWLPGIVEDRQPAPRSAQSLKPPFR